MKLLFAEDPDKNSERNKLKVTTFQVEIEYDKEDVGVAHINIPSKIYKKISSTEKLTRVIRILWQRVTSLCGMSISMAPELAIESTFLIRDEISGEERVFTGSVQKESRNYNILSDYKSVHSIQNIVSRLKSAVAPKNISQKLDNPNTFPNTRWKFSGLISLVLNFQCTYKWNFQKYPRYSKRIMEDQTAKKLISAI